jgi:hypothetical protein
MSFDNRMIKVWKLCEDYNGALLRVQFHVPGMQKRKRKRNQTDIPPFIAAAIKKLLSGHWLYFKHVIQLPTVVNEYSSVATGAQWDREMSVNVVKRLRIYNSLQHFFLTFQFQTVHCYMSVGHALSPCPTYP